MWYRYRPSAKRRGLNMMGVCTRAGAGCCEEDGSACLELGSTTAKDHSIDWALVKGRHSETGTCYVKGSTDEATPYVTEDS